MKFKGLTKIALAGAAVAVTAATLATSTYAWYVTNSTATVDGITGSTASVAGGNILVAQSLDQANGDIPGNFSTKFTLAAGNILQPLKVTATTGDNPTYTKTEGFIPVTPGTFAAGSNGAPGTLTADATLTNWVDENGSAITVGTPAWASESSGSAGDRRYMEFKIWLMSTDDVATTTMTLKVTNTKTNPNKQTVYTTVGMGNAHEVGDEFVINAAEALRFAYIEDDFTFTEVASPSSDPKTAGYYEKATSAGVPNGNYKLTEDTTVTEGKKYYEMTAATGNAANYNIFGVKEVTTVGTTYIETADTYDASNNMNANEYYYGVMGQYAVGTTLESNTAVYSVAAPTLNLPTINHSESGYATLALTDNTAKKLTFRVWLEGTDAQCFDCCSGQDFTFEIGFSK